MSLAVVGSGALELLKWIALVLMTGDHIDAAVYLRSVDWLYNLGRIAMPLFAAVFGYNLFRVGRDLDKLRDLRNRLLIFGCIAYPFHVQAVAHSWLTLNILFAFAVAVQLHIWLLVDRKSNLPKIIALFLLSGLFLEFAWVAPALVLSWHAVWKGKGKWWPELAVIACYFALALVNGNWWASASLPIIAAAMVLEPHLPRIRNLFWFYYPAHMALLVMLVAAAQMESAFVVAQLR